MQLPQLALYDDTPIYNTRAAVRMTQVEAPRLRAWERRYAILTPHRSTNSYRLYSERDLAIIRWLRDQVDAGMTISQATSYLRTTHAEASAVVANNQPPVLPPHFDDLVPLLVEAARQLDELTISQLLNHALAIATVEDVCQSLITPALHIVGQEWAADPEQITSEHFLSHIIRARLDALWQATYQPPTGPRIFVACVPGELHELGAFMLALFLRRQGAHVVYLGANNEATALAATVNQIKPAAICLSITLPEHRTRAIALARELVAATMTPIFIGGQGMVEQNGTPIAPQVTVLHASAQEAIDLIQRTVQIG